MYAIIMAGGSGTRFWPLSRARRPKQLLDIFGGRSMLAQTVERISPLIPPEHIIVVTGEHLLEPVYRALPEIPRQNILAEPAPRNTAPCIGLATALIARRCPDQDPVIGVFPADHHIGDPESFQRALHAAAQAAQDPGVIVTLGIRPTRPETGYGYIRYLPSRGIALDVERFVEKPDLDTARAYLESGSYLWNAGLFFFRASTMQAELARQLPDMARGLDQLAPSLDTDAQRDALSLIFPTLQSVSIDYGVMERALKVRVVATDPRWSDVGHWAALQGIIDPDEHNNARRGEFVTIDTEDSILLNEDPDHVVAVVGARDLVVVHTHDATLIMPRDRAQDVRAVVDALKKANHQDKL
jgi:mannose-1-phosphate guanylyltransferase